MSQVRVKEKTLAMVTSSSATNDVSTLYHLAQVAPTATMVKLMNHSHQCHYSIVKQKPSPPLGIPKCHSSLPVTHSRHQNSGIQDGHDGGDYGDNNLYNQQKRRLSFSIDAILNGGGEDVPLTKSKRLPSDVQNSHSIERTIYNSDKNDNKTGLRKKSGTGGSDGDGDGGVSSTKKGPTTGKGINYHGGHFQWHLFSLLFLFLFHPYPVSSLHSSSLAKSRSSITFCSTQVNLNHFVVST